MEVSMFSEAEDSISRLADEGSDHSSALAEGSLVKSEPQSTTETPTAHSSAGGVGGKPRRSGAAKRASSATGGGAAADTTSSAGRHPKGKGSTTGQRFNYKQTNVIRESHGNSIFGVAFNTRNRHSDKEPLLFSTVGGMNVTVYELLPAGEVTLLQAFKDPSPDEDYYCCAWSVDSRTREQIVAAAGKRGVIRLLCPSLASCLYNFTGHGESVNEVKFHTKDPTLLFSFSKDYTIRLWNVSQKLLVCVFGGAEGHRSEVLHGDVNLMGTMMISCGMDHAIKIWRLDTPKLQEVMEKSYNYDSANDKKSFPTLLQHFPDFTTRDAHGNYVDCCRWFGNLVFSKSCENSLVLWKPGQLNLDFELRLGDSKMSILHQLEARDCHIWYIRFDIDLENKVLALGSSVGRVYLWDLNTDDIFSLTPQVLNVTRGNGAVRQTCFGNNGKTLLCVCDFGVIVRFDRE